MKKAFITIIAIITVFINPANVWSANRNMDPVPEVITIDKSFFFINEPSYLQARNSIKSETEERGWIASIFITGLGQIIMGDTWRGLKFMLIQLAIFIIPYTYAGGFSRGFIDTIFLLIYNFYPIIFILAGIIAVHIWNIVDAYFMSRENSGSITLDQTKVRDLEKELTARLEIVSNTIVAEPGNFTLKVFTF